jgi:flagellar assembly protein FliH
VDFAFDTRIDQVLKNFFKENHQQLPAKNDDSNLFNDQPMPVTPPEEESPVQPETVETSEQVVNNG